MKVILLSWLILAHISSIKASAGVTIDGIIYDNEILVSSIRNTAWLSIGGNFRDLYFDYLSYVGNGTYLPKLAKLNLNNKNITFLSIPDVGYVSSYAINHEDEEVYVGSNDGILMYDMETDVTTHYGAAGMNVWQIYYKHFLYFRSDSEWYILNDGTSTLLVELQGTDAYDITIDGDMMYYVNPNGLFRKKAFSAAEPMEAGAPLSMRSIGQDPKGRLYLMSDDRLYYTVGENTLQATSLSPTGYCVAFDNDGSIYYSSWNNGIYRLIPRSGTKKNTGCFMLLALVLAKCISISVLTL